MTRRTSRSQSASTRPRVFLVFVGALTLLTPSAEAAPDFVGAERCGTCHQAEYQDWRQSGHAAAFARLSQVQQRDASCRGCHTMAPTSEDATLSGVQCESCHGPGRMYAPRHVMKDKELSKLLGLQAVVEDTCAGCHSKDTPSLKDFKFAEKILLVNHKAGAAKTSVAPEKKTQ